VSPASGSDELDVGYRNVGRIFGADDNNDNNDNNDDNNNNDYRDSILSNRDRG
jgi:hypothetical protein